MRLLKETVDISKRVDQNCIYNKILIKILIKSMALVLK